MMGTLQMRMDALTVLSTPAMLVQELLVCALNYVAMVFLIQEKHAMMAILMTMTDAPIVRLIAGGLAVEHQVLASISAGMESLREAKNVIQLIAF